MNDKRDIDTLVVGGGVVGMALAYGLAKAGERVRLLDEGDDAYRAARGNFGLVWVQGKGVSNPDYARWSMAAAASWPEFAQELQELTGVDVELSQAGGLTICLDEEEIQRRVENLESLRQSVGNHYRYSVLDAKAVRELSPYAGPQVVGGLFCPFSGHASPLRLLQALVRGFQRLGGQLVSGAGCERIEHRADGFHAWAAGVEHVAARVVLAAGLGNRALAPMVGLKAPVQPNRGQILVTERVEPFLRHASQHVRQTGEGVVQIGDSHEDVGLDEGTTVNQLARIADRARRYFPILENVNVVRSWGALRVMTPDGYPIYQASRDCPGAFVVTCHSGITLASMHASALVAWMRGGPEPADIFTFKAERFDV